MIISFTGNYVLNFYRRNWISVLLEIHEWLHFKKKNFRKKKRGLPFRFSLFSKIALLAFIVLFIGGTILIYLLEKITYF